MATTAATLVQRTRRFMQDWPEGDVLTASVTNNATQITVADTALYGAGWLIQLDQEGLQVRGAASGTLLNVFRGARGSTAASHANTSTVLVRPRFLDVQYLDALNAGINATFPWIYQPVVDESLATTANLYEYTIPNLNGSPIPYISELQFLESGDLSYRKFGSWTVMRGSTPKLKLRRPLPTGQLRVYGFGPIPQLTSLSDTLNSLYPAYAEDALIMFAAQYLLAAGEIARVREDTGARDQRENRNTVGSSAAIANAVFTRFQRRIMDAGLPPMPKHAVSTL